MAMIIAVPDSPDRREHLLVLSEAGKSIGTTLDVMKTAQKLADFAVPSLADYVTIDLAESVPLGDEPLQRITAMDHRVPVFRRAGAASIHPSSPSTPTGSSNPAAPTSTKE